MNTLWTSLRSPFGRRVRIALDERRIPYEEKMLDVFAPPSEFLQLAPLGRVPVWVDEAGVAVADSNAILTGLLAHQPLTPSEILTPTLAWMGLAVGVMEKTVAQYLAWTQARTLGGRPDQELLDEYRSVREAFCTRVENAAAAVLQAGGTYLCAGALTQADIDVCVALAYITLRDSPEWQERYPNARRYAAQLEQRPAFLRTYPPQL